MDIFILLATMIFCFPIGMPIAYSLATAAIVGAICLDSARSGDAEDLGRRQQGGDAHHPVLRARRRHHGRKAAWQNAWSRSPTCWSDYTRLRGGLSIVNVVATTFLSGISGSAVADTSAIGSVMIPQMEKTGYPRVFATNLTITSSVQALLVPPSHNAVLYSLATGGTISISAPCSWPAYFLACCSASR